LELFERRSFGDARFLTSVKSRAQDFYVRKLEKFWESRGSD
jgi:hypothetical protein